MTNEGGEEDEKQQVTLKVKDHPDIRADHVIITSSLGYLKENHRRIFQPALPSEKQQAISTMCFGTVDKIFLKFKKPFWMHLRKGDVEGMQLLWEKDLWHDDVPVPMGSEERKRKLGEMNNRMAIMRRIIGWFVLVVRHASIFLC